MRVTCAGNQHVFKGSNVPDGVGDGTHQSQFIVEADGVEGFPKRV
jgi:hypothetical protein